MDEQAHEELVLLYNVSVQDLANFKRQQITLVNYILVIDAALLALKSQIHPTPVPHPNVCTLALWLLSLVAAWHLRNLECGINLRRKRLDNISCKFSTEFKVCRVKNTSKFGQDADPNTSKGYGQSVLLTLLAIVFAGPLLVAYVLPTNGALRIVLTVFSVIAIVLAMTLLFCPRLRILTLKLCLCLKKKIGLSQLCEEPAESRTEEL